MATLYLAQQTKLFGGSNTNKWRIVLNINTRCPVKQILVFAFRLGIKSQSISYSQSFEKMEQQVCLRWNNFQSSLASTLEFMWDEESLVDVTLFCEGEQIRAHKVVLSACSSVFKTLLKNNSCPHPIIILHSVSLCDLEAILQFIYKGEVNIEQKQLNRLLQTATTLQIRGLAGIAEREKAGEEPTAEPPLKKAKKVALKTCNPVKTAVSKRKLVVSNDIDIEEHSLVIPKAEPLSEEEEEANKVTINERNAEEPAEEDELLQHPNQSALKPSELPHENSSIDAQPNSTNQGIII